VSNTESNREVSLDVIAYSQQQNIWLLLILHQLISLLKIV